MWLRVTLRAQVIILMASVVMDSVIIERELEASVVSVPNLLFGNSDRRLPSTLHYSPNYINGSKLNKMQVEFNFRFQLSPRRQNGGTGISTK